MLLHHYGQIWSGSYTGIMANSTPISDRQALEGTWREIEGRLEALAQCARSGCAPKDFYGMLLSQLDGLADQADASCWRLGANGWCQVDSFGATGGKHPSLGAKPTPAAWLAQTAEGGQVASFAWRTEDSTEAVTILGPILSGGVVAEVLEFRVASPSGPAMLENQMELVRAYCEIASDFAERQSNAVARSATERWRGVAAFAMAAHRQLDQTATCFAITNEARRLLSCDRFSVAVRSGRRYRLQSISGVDHFDKRSDEVLCLERLAAAVAQGGEPIWQDDEDASIAPPISQGLSDFMDRSTCRSVAVLPLFDPPRSEADDDETGRVKTVACQAVLVIERYDGAGFDRAFRQLAWAIAQQSQLAISNASQFSRVPRFLRFIGCGLSQLPRGRVAVASALFGSVAAFVAALAFVETDFQVHCRGQLEPSHQRDIFAPATGTIEQLSIDSGDAVRKSDHLLRIASTDLEYELARVNGELETRRQDLHALQAQSRTASNKDGHRQDQRLTRAAEETMLKSTISTLEEQLALLHSREVELTVTSPLTGTVMTADVARRLTARPVRQGQRLLTVATLDDDWQLNLKIEDRDFGHVRDALDEGHDSAKVEYLLTTDLSQKHEAMLTNVGITTEVDKEIGAFVRGTVVISDAPHDTLKAGATVIARIDCGRRSLAFVWFRDVWELLRTRLFW